MGSMKNFLYSGQKVGLFTIIVTLTVILNGCTTYDGVAIYGSDEILVGTIEANVMQGSASFQFKSKKSALSCEGIAETPYYIPNSFTCEGQRGRGFAACSDGKRKETVKFEWAVVDPSCQYMDGNGVDSLGKTFYFVTGMNETEALKYLVEKMNKAPKSGDR